MDVNRSISGKNRILDGTDPMVIKLIKLSIQLSHSLLPNSLKKLALEEAYKLGLPEQEVREALRTLYKEIFDEALKELE